jgi:NAD(P)-dependent dehydrogenase (short-subunit alcohol dehydrogenase family)
MVEAAKGRTKRATAADAPAPKGELDGRIALITGASRGIGAAIARRYAAEGAHVILAARTVGGLEEVDDAIQAAGGQATLVPVDVTDFDKIDHMGAAIAERFGRLDVLVGNAGALGTLGPVGHVKPEDWDEVMKVNVTANWRLIRSFDPLLRRSPSGRAIFVTSGVANGVFPYWSAYAASKAALEMLAKVYAGEVAKTKIKVNLLDPGIVRTAMRARAFPGEDPAKLAEPESVADAFVHLASAACSFHGQVIRAY